MRLALDRKRVVKRAGMYSPLALLTAIDGQFVVWLPWIETEATKQLDGYPDLALLAFTSVSLLCRKIPFMVVIVKLSESSMSIIQIVSMVTTGLSILHSLVLRLLQALGFSSQHLDVIVGTAADFRKTRC